MGKTDRSAQRKTSALVTLILVAVLGIAAAGLYHLDSLKKDALLTQSQLKQQLEEVNVEIEGAKEEAGSIQVKIEEEEHKNYDPVLKKQEFYEVAKQLEDAVLAGTADCKIAYLTFDDGPYEATSMGFLDVLDEYDVLATFFLLGKDSDLHKEIIRREYNTGHTVANHTYSHKIRNGIYRSVDAFIEDVMKNREYIQNLIGYTTNILRFPGGTPTAGSLKPGIVEKLQELGYGYVDWDAEDGDGKLINLSKDEYVENLFNTVHDQKLLVVLLHDYCNGTLEALPEIITGLRERGYIFLPLFYESNAIHKS